jgi:sulfur transfer protein SufE
LGGFRRSLPWVRSNGLRKIAKKVKRKKVKRVEFRKVLRKTIFGA